MLPITYVPYRDDRLPVVIIQSHLVLQDEPDEIFIYPLYEFSLGHYKRLFSRPSQNSTVLEAFPGLVFKIATVDKAQRIYRLHLISLPPIQVELPLANGVTKRPYTKRQ